MKNKLNFKNCLIVFYLLCTTNTYAQENVFSKHVNIYENGYTYENEYDTSKFRLGIINSPFSSQVKNPTRVPSSIDNIGDKLKNSNSNICATVKNSKGLKLKDSATYVVSALKKAGVIEGNDKEYSLDSANYFWEFYLSYRDFVDISLSISRDKEYFTLSKLPDATIVTVEKGCNVNGLVAIHCNGLYYSPKFVDIKKLEKRLNDPTDQACKIGRGFRIIAEAKRFL